MWKKIFLLNIIFMAAAQAQESQEVVLDKGLVFMQEGNFLLSGDRWILTLDISFDQFREAIRLFLIEVNKVGAVQAKPHVNQTGITHLEFQDSMAKEIKILVEEALQVLNEITSVENTLTPVSQERGKRGLINVGGDVLKFLFGTLSNKDLNRINAKISTLKVKTDKLTHVVEEQFTILKEIQISTAKNAANIQILTNATELLAIEVKRIETKVMTELALLKWKQKVDQATNVVMRILGMSLEEIKMEINLFKQALDMTALGKLNSYFLPPRQLFRVLSGIQPKLPEEMALITSLHMDEIYKYYSLASVHALSLPKTVRLFIELPMRAPNRYFNVYRALPLPVPATPMSMSFFINPPYPYLAITADQAMYMTLTTEDLLQCANKQIKICPPRWPIRLHTEPSCLYSLFTGDNKSAIKLCERQVIKNYSPYFYKTRESSEWFYSVPTMTPAILQCQAQNETLGSKTPKPLLFRNTGIIKLNPTCSISSKNFILLTQTEGFSSIEGELPSLHVPPVDSILDGEEFNFVIEAFDNGLLPNITNYLETIKESALPFSGISMTNLAQHIEELKKIKIKQTEDDDYFWTFILLGIISLIIIAIAGFFLYRKYKSRAIYSVIKPKATYRKEPTVEPVELGELNESVEVYTDQA